MIQKPNNWNEVKELNDRPKLPLGAYVCRVKQSKIMYTDYGEQLAILFDICEGEYKDYFNKEFNDSTYQDKKWKGVLRQWLPTNDGSERDELTKSILKGMVTAFEKSNPGYQWDWNEASLVTKNVGIVFRNEEWEKDGKNGWVVRPFRAVSVDSVREGTYNLPKDKPLKNKSEAGEQNIGGFTQVNEDDLPF